MSDGELQPDRPGDGVARPKGGSRSGPTTPTRTIDVSYLTLPSSPVGRATSSTLLCMPQEVLLHVLAFLDVPDLIAVSRTCRTLRTIPSDPLLHRQRLHAVPRRLSQSLSARPPLSALRPPNAYIYLTSTLAAARKISRNLLCARLKRQLDRRPQVTELVDRGVLPGECFVLVASTTRTPPTASRASERKSISSTRSLASASTKIDRESEAEERRSSSSTLRQEQNPTPPRFRQKYVSPRLIEAKRAIEREAIRDRIRRWVDGRGKQEFERRRRERERELESGEGEDARIGVKGLARRFKKKEMDVDIDIAKGGSEGPNPVNQTERWGKGAAKWVERRRREPTRAHVLGLRRFWEGVGRES